MATIIEFDRRYFKQAAAAADVPDMGVTGFRVVPHPSAHRNPCTGAWEPWTEYRLQLHTDRPLPVLKQLKRLHPLRTYRVIETDASRP